jgi:hypothetical protein
MNRSKALSFLPVLLLAALTCSSCSGPTGVIVCKVNCGGGGGGTVSVTMVADTLPAHPSFLTFRVTITGISLVTSGGAQHALTLKGSPIVDLMRLQTDTLYLGTFANIPAGQYTGVIVSFSSPVLTFFNDTTGTLQTCPAATGCTQISIASAGIAQANVNFSVSSTTGAGIQLDLDLGNLAIISGTNLTVNFANPQVLSVNTLPRSGSNLPSGQLDLIEDFTGVVSIVNSAVTITSAAATNRGALTATASANTIFDADPSGTLCKNPTPGNASTCVANNQFASMDVILKSDGTLAIEEIEPLLATLQDTVEGIVVAINLSKTTQFTMIVTDIIPAAKNSLIGSLQIGDGLIVNLANNPTPFFVDTKGLSVLPGVLNNFAGQNNTTAIHLGQSVAVHVTAFTAATANTFASTTNTDTVTLRWSRFTATPQAPSSPAFNITAIPTYFAFTQNSIFTVQTTTGTPGTRGVTNFDGILDGTSINTARPIALRALFLENPGLSANPAFTAAKVRQH